MQPFIPSAIGFFRKNIKVWKVELVKNGNQSNQFSNGGRRVLILTMQTGTKYLSFHTKLQNNQNIPYIVIPTKLYLTKLKLTPNYVLFVWSLSSHSRSFHSYGVVTIANEGLQILTYARHSWPLSSECSLKCHTFCDTGLPFKMVISENPWHSNMLPSVWQ